MIWKHSDDLFLLERALLIYSIYRYALFILFPDYTFNSCNYVTSLILDMGNVCLFVFLSILGWHVIDFLDLLKKHMSPIPGIVIAVPFR